MTHKEAKFACRYDRLRQERPDAVSRVEIYEGNLVCENLGIRREDQKAFSQVSVVFHAAGPSEELLQYCREFKNLCAVVVATDLFRSVMASTLYFAFLEIKYQ